MGYWRLSRRWRVGLALAVVAGCQAGRQPAPPPPAAEAPATFVNRVWRVASSPDVEAGMLYVFLSDGTLVISSPHGTPALGSWTREGSGLTMVEEGRSYKVDVLALSAGEFRIRMHNPGEPVEITFAPADAGAPPGTPR